ncbi:Flp pilus assembly protein CpaB [Effusibacillus dendaii]|uniref:SAF domain-containing protein n=1 Tax=Effusibacillus dendaii TaxID=2743772 RepID=A0A7I8DDG4_9BACL|nr:SAF domain-containing protein [Effusibacillus dendaii]BCJ88164.1 hypothetical protein skT53_31490 [Effusibacillus dendaii]
MKTWRIRLWSGFQPRSKRILFAFVGAALSTWMLYLTVSPPAVKETVQVVEASAPIAKNQKITPASLTLAPIPSSSYQSWMVRDPAQLIGKYAEVDIFPGEWVRAERVAEKQAANFQPDERVMNLPVQLANLGGMPKQGDVVDVIAYFQPPQKGAGIGHTELILQNVYIQSMVTKEGKQPPTEQQSKGKEDFVPAIVSLKVTVQDSLLLSTLIGSPDVAIRLIGRQPNSSNVQIKSPVADQLRRTGME